MPFQILILMKYIPDSVRFIDDNAFTSEESNDGKIYVKAGSYAEEDFEDANYSGELVVE